MTTPPPLNTSAIMSVLLGDGIWHAVQPGTMLLFTNPQFADPTGGPPETVGGQWFQFQDTAVPPVSYGVPVEQVRAVQWVPGPGQ